MDFVSDTLFDGKRFRALTLIDTFTRECLAVHVDISIKGERVIETLEIRCPCGCHALNMQIFVRLLKTYA